MRLRFFTSKGEHLLEQSKENLPLNKVMIVCEIKNYCSYFDTFRGGALGSQKSYIGQDNHYMDPKDQADITETDRQCKNNP